MLPDQVFYENMTGQAGPERQLQSFRACWERAHTYVAAINQSAIGCAQRLEGKVDEQTRIDLNALCLVLDNVNAWFSRCAKEYKALHEQITELAKNSAVH